VRSESTPSVEFETSKQVRILAFSECLVIEVLNYKELWFLDHLLWWAGVDGKNRSMSTVTERASDARVAQGQSRPVL